MAGVLVNGGALLHEAIHVRDGNQDSDRAVREHLGDGKLVQIK
jgi:hypothetical protein